MLTKEQRAALPKKPANRAEMDSFNYLSACLTDMLEAQKTLEKRARMVPGGWRNLRMMTAVLENFLTDMLGTFEADKLRQIQRTSKSVRHKLVFSKAVIDEGEQFLIAMDDLGYLVSAAVSGQCKICMGSPAECRQCQLGKVLDGVSFVTRGDRGWWEVFEQAERRDIGAEDTCD